MAITVQEALQTEGLNRARVVAGHAGLTNDVGSVTVMDSPAIPSWLRGGELILTSFFAVKEGPHARSQLLPAFVERGCAGLVIQTGRYVDEVPADIVKAANRLGFPVIELPVDLAYADVITPLMERILMEKARLLRHSDTVHRKLTRGALSGGGLASTVALVSEQIRCRVAILDPGLRCVAADPGVDQSSLAAWLEVHDPVSEAWAGAKEPFRQLPGPLGESAVSAPVRVDSDTLGHFVLWPLRLPLDEESVVVLEHAVTVGALELLKQQAIKQVERRYHDEVMADLLQGRIANLADLEQRSRHLDWNLDLRYRLLLFDLSPLRRAERGEALRQTAVDAALRTVQGMTPRPIVALVQSDLVLLLPEGVPTRVDSAVEGIVRAVQFQIAHRTNGVKSTVGVSESVPTMLHLKKAYDEARNAAELARLIQGAGTSAFFQKLGIYRLLKDCSPSISEEFMEAVIGPILEHDRERNGRLLMETLEAYLDARGQAKAAAVRLFVHVNTVKYRLNQIEELTGHSPETPEGILNLGLALKLLDLMGRRWRTN